ncbi:MAG: hypothetical protein OEX07_06655 [Gammaproteobacteria bacterium]|nr:hypothetical protein [Gammaproteobacteria bacterium]
MSGAISGFSTMANINRSVAQLGQANKVSHNQTVRHLETINAKVDRAAQDVISSAVDIKSTATEAKGNTINVLA